MASFSLPHIVDNPDGGWGPSAVNLPEQFKFKDIPYAPFSKSDKLGRFADWNETASDTRQSAAGAPATQNTRQGPLNRRRDGAPTFGSGTASAFAYFHVEDESSFSLVDNKAAPPRKSGTSRGRGNARGGAQYNARGGARMGRGGIGGRNAMNQRNPGRRGWRDWDKVRFQGALLHMKILWAVREIGRANHLLSFLLNGVCWRKLTSSACQNYEWMLMNQKICESLKLLPLVYLIFVRDMYGRIFAYDKTYDRITTKSERPLQATDRIKYNTTTSDDPVIQQVNAQKSNHSLY